MSARRRTVMALYVGLTILFGGGVGALVGIAIVAAWTQLRPSPRAFWAASVLCLALAPFALMAQGLPRTPVVGPGFGVSHLWAHVLVGLALALCTFAALLDLTGIRPSEAEAGSWFRRRQGSVNEDRGAPVGTAEPREEAEGDAGRADPPPFD